MIKRGLASLFSGVGGLDEGFLNGPLAFGGAWDINPSAIATYAHNHRIEAQVRDVQTMAPRDLGQPKFVLAGPPCQGFSSLGRMDAADERNQLILTASRLIAATRPTGFMIENVMGIRWLSNGRFLSQTLENLRAHNLRAEAFVLDCAGLGLPQKRRRLIIVGGNKQFGPKFISGVDALLKQKHQASSVADALLPVPELESLPNHSARAITTPWYRSIVASLKPGQKLCDTRLGPASVHSWDIPIVFGRISSEEKGLLLAVARMRRSERGRRYVHIGDGKPVPIANAAKVLGTSVARTKSLARALALKRYLILVGRDEIDLARRFNGRFKRLPLDGCSPAVLREFAHARSILHPVESRALTVRECARLQGFDDRFVFLGSRLEQYQLVANSFPPSISKRLAQVAWEALRSC